MGTCEFITSVINCVTKGGETPSDPVPTPQKTPLAYKPKPKSDRVHQISNILGRETGDVKDVYTIGQEIGKGQFGPTHVATDRKTGEHVVCKIIVKRKLLLKEEIEDVRREVAVMHHLAGHHSFVQLLGAYEDSSSVHLVLERCVGGELFERIVRKGKYSERSAAATARGVVGAVERCHALGVMHRDLRPENFMFQSKKEDSPLKATEFGAAIFFKPGETFTDIKGSAHYVAPEVLRRKYGPEADVWSCGVILYILLCGVHPFWGEDEQSVFDAILRGAIDFKSPPWPHISEQAKDLIRKMLNQDPKERPTPSQILRHPWIKVGGSAPDKALDSTVVNRLKHFSAMNKMKKIALKVIASSLSEEEIKGLKQMFIQMDTDNSGSITYTEMKAGLAIYGANMPEEEIKLLMEGADVDHSGSINYEEFISATMNLSKAYKEENLFKAFQHFDKDNSGYISMEELRKALSEDGELERYEIDAIIKEVDADKDGNINYEEFVAMMQGGTGGGDAKPRGSTTRRY